MTWLTPITGLILAACIVPPLLFLYFLKLRRRPMAIASTLLWKRSVEDLQANAPFQRLRKSLLLLLQLLVIAFLALSVMQPQIQGTGASDGRTVIFIDNSASMTAIDGEDDDETRLDLAKDMARQRVEAMYAGGLFSETPGETMIVAFSDRAEIQARFTRSRQQLLQAIDRIKPTHGETRIAQALQLARAYTTDTDPDSNRPIAEPADYLMFSDGKIDDLTGQVLRGERLEFVPIGSATPDNVAVGRVSLERPYDRPTEVEVFVSMMNFNMTEVTCDVQLSVDNVARGIVSVTIPPAEQIEGQEELVPRRANAVFPAFELPRGAVIEVANLRPDDLAADNTGQVVLAPPRQLNVALVGDRSQLLVDVLEGMSLAGLSVISVDGFRAMIQTGEHERFDVVVLVDVEIDALPSGRYLSFGTTPPVEGLNEFGEGDGLIVMHFEKTHPVLSYTQLDNVVAREYHKLQPDEDVLVLAQGAGGNNDGTTSTSTVPVIVQVTRGDLQLVHVVFNPLQSRWPFQRSFVAFLMNTVDYLGHYGEGLNNAGYRPGEAIATRLPSTATDITLQMPNGDAESINPLNPELVSWGPIRESGMYLLSWREPDRPELQFRPFAVNLITDFEGDIASRNAIAIGQDTVEGVAGRRTEYIALWPWAVGLCLAMMLFEWWIYHRKMMF